MFDLLRFFLANERHAVVSQPVEMLIIYVIFLIFSFCPKPCTGPKHCAQPVYDL